VKMSGDSLITDQMKAQIGKEINFGAPFEVEKGAIRSMAEAMNFLHPLYLDEKYALSKGHSSVVAPPGFAAYDLPLGAPLGVLKFPFEIVSGLHGSDDWEYFKDIHARDVLTPRGKIIDLIEKVGKMGRMLFVVSEVTFTNQRSEVVAIYRPTEIIIAGQSK
jgi:hypothetical protein